MTDKVQKIREDVVRLKSNLIHGACASQIAMETRCKEEAYNEVLAILDTMQEEHVSGLDNGDMPIERWKQAVKAASNQRNYRSSKGLTETRDDYFVDGVQWADEHPKKEHVSEEWIEELRTKLDSMSKEEFEQLWEKYGVEEKEEPVSEELIDVAKQYVKEHVIGIDKVTFSIATDMFISGAKWQKEQDQSTIELAEDHAMLAGMEKMKEQMVGKAIDGKIYETQGRSKLKAVTTGYLSRIDYEVGDKIKVIIIKED